jgi:hypothetical protein
MFLLDIQPPFSVYSTHSKATSYQPIINHGGGASGQGLDRVAEIGKSGEELYQERWELWIGLSKKPWP